MAYVSSPINTLEYTGFNHKLVDLVSFPTYDGTILKGNIYKPQTPPPTPNGYPSVIMTQGLGLLKEHYLHNWANHFASTGYLVLAYDHRNFGHSGGEVRNEVNPIQQADDYVDAVNYMVGRSDVDEKRVVLWGIGHAAGAAGTAASFDRRLKGVILVMPSCTGKNDQALFPPRLSQAANDSRILNAEVSANSKTSYAQFWPVTEQDRLGQGNSILSGDITSNWAHLAFDLAKEGGSEFENKVALSSMYYLFKARPMEYFKDISPTPVLYLPASEDPLSLGIKEQLEIFEGMGEPKELVVLQGSHLNNYFNKTHDGKENKTFSIGVEAMLRFLNGLNKD